MTWYKGQQIETIIIFLLFEIGQKRNWVCHIFQVYYKLVVHRLKDQYLVHHVGGFVAALKCADALADLFYGNSVQVWQHETLHDLPQAAHSSTLEDVTGGVNWHENKQVLIQVYNTKWARTRFGASSPTQRCDLQAWLRRFLYSFQLRPPLTASPGVAQQGHSEQGAGKGGQRGDQTGLQGARLAQGCNQTCKKTQLHQ